jgi:hypothetical protein
MTYFGEEDIYRQWLVHPHALVSVSQKIIIFHSSLEGIVNKIGLTTRKWCFNLVYTFILSYALFLWDVYACLHYTLHVGLMFQQHTLVMTFSTYLQTY